VVAVVTVLSPSSHRRPRPDEQVVQSNVRRSGKQGRFAALYSHSSVLVADTNLKVSGQMQDLGSLRPKQVSGAGLNCK